MNYQKDFLPFNLSHPKNKRNYDVILITGDAYVDHPTFGAAVIGRYLESYGFSTAVISQPDWNSDKDFKIFGKPNLFFGITSGNMDSMVNHFTSAKKRRHDDYFTPGKKYAERPDRAAIVYSNKIREIFGQIPIVLGGIEASLRRIAHYDFWSNKIRNSILVDSDADIIVYGPGEKTALKIAQELKSGKSVSEITDVKGTLYKTKDDVNFPVIEMPEVSEVKKNKDKYLKAYKIHYEYIISPDKNKKLLQKHYNWNVLMNPPDNSYTQEDLDYIYTLPYTRRYHPVYNEKGGVPALETVQFSITTHRGCFGGCSFCSLFMHQGKKIVSRSEDSIMYELEKIVSMPEFKGTVTDAGGPSANMYSGECLINGKYCKRGSCINPNICSNLKLQQGKHLSILKKIKKHPKVKHLFVQSGIRHDLAVLDKNYLSSVTSEFTGGHLKIAPEHIVDRVLKLMQKPSRKVFAEFLKWFRKYSQRSRKKQYIVPYIIAGHPGSTIEDMVETALFLSRNNIMVEQVQLFLPTPLTLSSAMYYGSKNPLTGEEVFSEKSPKFRELQKLILFYRKKKYRKKIISGLQQMKKGHLIQKLYSK